MKKIVLCLVLLAACTDPASPQYRVDVSALGDAGTIVPSWLQLQGHGSVVFAEYGPYVDVGIAPVSYQTVKCPPGGSVVLGWDPDPVMPPDQTFVWMTVMGGNLTMRHESALETVETNRLLLVGQGDFIVRPHGGFLMTRVDEPGLGLRWVIVSANK